MHKLNLLRNNCYRTAVICFIAFVFAGNTFSSESQLESLYRDLGDPDQEIRSDAILALGEAGDENAISLIIPLLGDKSILVRHCAAEALARIGGKEVRIIFADMLESSSVEKKRIGAAGLARVGAYGESYNKLVELLNDDNWQVRWAAVLALGQSGNKNIIDRIEFISKNDKYKKSNDSFPVREVAVSSLKKLKNEIKWWKTFAETILVAARRNQKIYLLFYLDDSIWCNKLEKEVLGKPDIRDLLGDYVCVRMNPLKCKSLADMYNIKGVPLTLILNSKGEEISRMNGYVDSESMKKYLVESLGKSVSINKLRNEFKNSPDNTAVALILARELMDRDSYSEAVEVLSAIINNDMLAEKKQEEQALFYLGYCTGALERHSDSIKYFNLLVEKYPEYAEIDKSLFCMGLSHLALGKVAESCKTFKTLIEKYPSSAVSVSAREVLAKISKRKQKL
ncbi:MAG: HEAT repeat domain-containing protein [Candidatus Theseobacter exili]|nr:HEAT repeat domain-containing protein [Candidatus Theseobacter exili]